MSVEHIAVVLHHSKAKGTAKLILLGIANHAGDGGAWPSLATLARYANVTPRNVQKALTSLQGSGELRIAVQAGGPADLADTRRPNRYDVLVECPPWCDRSPNHRDTRRSAGAQLWIDPLSETTPPVGNDTPPLSETTPHPPSETTPKPSIEPTLNSSGSSPASTTDRRLCSECHMPAWYCIPRQHLSGHTFQPKTQQPKALTVVEARTELHQVIDR